MRRVYLFMLPLFLMVQQACRDDDSYKPAGPDTDKKANIDLVLTGRVGTVVGEELTAYVKALNLLLFRENEAGVYTLYRSEVLNKARLAALGVQEEEVQAGFTVPREMTFDSIPVGNYKIVGIGNALDSLGNTLPNISLQGITIGNTMDRILATVRDGDEASRLFWGETQIIQAGAAVDRLPMLSLYRKVAMFAITLEKIPNVVNRIDMQIESLYGRLNMDGEFPGGTENYVYSSHRYTQQVQDSITLTYVTLPTVSGDSSSFLTTFYLADGPKQPVTLPKYVLKPNTITRVTATIDPDQAGNTWKVNVNTLISVNVEWNVDQEPPITI